MTAMAEAVINEARATPIRHLRRPAAARQSTIAEAVMFKTILVATDGSVHAERAVGLAADIAEKYGARLVLLHVLLHDHIPEALRHMAETEHMVPRPQPVPSAPAPAPAPMFELIEYISRANVDTVAMTQVFTALGDQILGRAKRAAREKGVKDIAIRIDDGDPARRIIECAKAEGADLIVLGSRGLGDLEGLFMGSVSHRVSQLAECSCVTVK
jgi:nucleotide-binding universal stress UspA family protein